MLCLALISSCLVNQYAFTMKERPSNNNYIRPPDPQTVGQLTNGDDQKNMFFALHQKIETIKMIILSNRTTRLANLHLMGYSTYEAETACKELPNVSQPLLDDIRNAKEEERLEQQKQQKQQRDKLFFIQSIIQQQRENNVPIQTIKNNLFQMGFETEDIAQAFNELGIQEPSNPLPKAPELNPAFEWPNEDLVDEEPLFEVPITSQDKENKKPWVKKVELDSDGDVVMREDEPESSEEEVKMLITIIQAIHNSNIQVSLQIHARLQYEDLKELTPEKLLAHNFKNIDIVEACQQIGANHLPDSFKKLVK